MARRYLEDRGLSTVSRNYRCRLGEIDLVMCEGHCLVIVEVRYRGGKQRIKAGVTVDRRKQHKLIRTAALFLTRHARYADWPVRFDVVAIDDRDYAGPAIEWIRDAFRPADATL